MGMVGKENGSHACFQWYDMEDARIETGEDKVLLRVLVDWHIRGMLLFLSRQGNLGTPQTVVLKNLFTRRVVKHWKTCPGRLGNLSPWRYSKLN